MDEREVDVGTVLMGGRTGWEKRLEVEQGERGAVGLGGSAMPIRLAAACSRSIESLCIVSYHSCSGCRSIDLLLL